VVRLRRRGEVRVRARVRVRVRVRVRLTARVGVRSYEYRRVRHEGHTARLTLADHAVLKCLGLGIGFGLGRVR